MKRNELWKSLVAKPPKMRFLVMLMCIFCTFNAVFANVAADKTVTIKSENISVKEALNMVKKQTGINIMYEDATLNNVPLKLTLNKEPLEQALSVICSQAGMRYELVENNYVLILPIDRNAKRRTITGVIKDDTGEPVIGASIVIQGTTFGTVANMDGQFMLSYPENTKNDELMISFIGMQTVKEKIGNRHVFNVKMESEVTNLDEVVVVGYGTSSIKDLTGSVASVGLKQLSQLNTPNVTSMLQNLAAGVQVSQNTGVPGETVRVRVRGATSLTGSNEPLYVIDGVPVEDPSMLDAISPNDIQSMDVLKDASAAAIYGSRAANGVVIVTTKKGVEGSKPTVSFNYNVTTDVQIKNFRILYGDEWRETVRRFAKETLVYDPSNQYALEILEPNSTALGSANTNWFDEVKQTAIRHNADLTVSGGSKVSKYLISLSVFDQQGMVKGGDLSRYNARVSTEMNVLPILRFGINANMSYTDQNNANTSLFSAQGFRPDLPIYNDNGEFDMSTGQANPVANTYKKNHDNIYRIMGTVYGEVDIWKGFRFRSSLSGNLQFTENNSFSPSFLSTRNEASGSEYHYKYSKTVFDNTLNYNYEFNKNHVLDAVAGISFERGISRSTRMNSQTYPDNDIYTNLGSAASISSWGNGYNASGLFSSFARINYKLMERYLFTFTGRYDGSSMFGSNNRYGFFPSGAIAWRISQEKFMKNLTFINDLKLRASVGTTGTQNLTSFSNRDLYEATSYNNLSAIIHKQVGNRDIRWEKSTQYDLGLDFALFDYRLTGSISGYIKDTKDLIWSFDFPPSATGGSMQMNRNIGALTNRGIEINLVGRVLSTKDWNLDLTLNMSHNKNKVTKLVEEGRAQSAMNVVVQGSYADQVLAVGYPMGAFHGYEYAGIIQDQARIDELNAYAKSKGQSYYDGNSLKPGHLEIKDLNGDGIINYNDRVIIGNPDPDLFGGLTANLSYKQFSLFANFGYQIGGLKIYNKTLQNLPGQLTGLIDYGLNDRWSDTNKDAKYPALYIGDGVPRLTDHELFNASFFRLQEVRLTYNLPLNKVIKGQLFVSATNLFTLTSYPGTDPATVNSNSNYGGNYETSTYPGFRSFSAGLKINL